LFCFIFHFIYSISFYYSFSIFLFFSDDFLDCFSFLTSCFIIPSLFLLHGRSIRRARNRLRNSRRSASSIQAVPSHPGSGSFRAEGLRRRPGTGKEIAEINKTAGQSSGDSTCDKNNKQQAEVKNSMHEDEQRQNKEDTRAARLHDTELRKIMEPKRNMLNKGLRDVGFNRASSSSVKNDKRN
jgi:hypothetical protein